MTHYDLTDASYELGKIIDADLHALMKRAHDAGITLDFADIKIINGCRTVDGMPILDWLDHMGA